MQLQEKLAEAYLRAVSALGVKPNHLTLAGLCLALVAPVAAYAGYTVAVVALMALSALMDALDGYTARALKMTSKWGAFLDSTADRVADSMFVLSLMLLGLNPTACFLLLTSSLLISYTRARGEALGLSFKGVGLIERQERVLLLIVIAVLTLYDVRIAEIGVLATLVMSIATVVQRILHARRGLQPWGA
ncbi:MAG: CDP-alcohol phosphatidyltransferase family protein [Acidilobaceae archaeon]